MQRTQAIPYSIVRVATKGNSPKPFRPDRALLDQMQPMENIHEHFSDRGDRCVFAGTVRAGVPVAGPPAEKRKLPCLPGDQSGSCPQPSRKRRVTKRTRVAVMLRRSAKCRLRKTAGPNRNRQPSLRVAWRSLQTGANAQLIQMAGPYER